MTTHEKDFTTRGPPTLPIFITLRYSRKAFGGALLYTVRYLRKDKEELFLFTAHC